MDALRRGPLVIDGAMGTQLYERGVLFSSCFEELNLSRPELVEKVHGEYVAAGATLIETNTFGAHAMRLEKHNLVSQVRAINEAAVVIARRAAKDRAYVAGAIGPSGYFLGDALDEDLRKIGTSMREQAEALCGAGVDALLVETMRQPAEMKVALDAVRRASDGKVPIFATFSVDTEGRLADGTDAETAGKMLRDWGADVIGVNCSDGPMNVLEAVERMLKAGMPVMAIPNAGLPRRVDDRLVYVSTPEYFGVFARRLFKLGVRAVGGCCGTTPDHVRRIAAAARMALASDGTIEDSAAAESGTMESLVPPASAAVVHVTDNTRSELRRNIGTKFVVSVEVNPPVGLDLTKQLTAARMLKDAGIDTINIADGARAQARMGNVALAMRVQELGMESILHVCGRDRNLLATLAHLLSAHELGVRNLVIITGDPPKMGDYPDASAVYDLDSIGMLKMASRLNRGIDPAGKPLGAGTRFVLATGAEPAALNYDRELSRLREKRASGAEIVMTQPVYDVAVLDRFLKDIEPLGMPVMVGLLPLASFKNAEFLHNEVPGMQVPEHIRERMKKAGGSGPNARREGVEIAREMLTAVKDRVQGAYIMPPLERYELAVEVVRGIVR